MNGRRDSPPWVTRWAVRRPLPVARSALTNGRSLSTLYVNAKGLSSYRVICPETGFVRGDGSNNGADFTVNVANDVLFALGAFTVGLYPFLPSEPCTLDLSSGE